MGRYVYHGMIQHLEPNQIFVFGSNPEGRHGMGAARTAMQKFGAKYGQGRGLMGQSYGLITKNLRDGYTDEHGTTYEKSGRRSISKEMMIENIKELYKCARSMKEKQFLVAYSDSGKNLNGYTNREMASFFCDASKKIPKNIVFEAGFYDLITQCK